MVVVVTPEGIIRTLYHEEWALAALGLLHIERASHVEPTPEGQVLSPVENGGALRGKMAALGPGGGIER